jgi:solute carrier family 8 (sodium/calcium exchanger)
MKKASPVHLLMHLITVFWKVLAAFVPPVSMAGGWATFVGALGMIALQTAFVADIAEMIGCCLDFPDLITAITLVALGTSLPDTFASMSAAMEDEFADASITNVTGRLELRMLILYNRRCIDNECDWYLKMGDELATR